MRITKYAQSTVLVEEEGKRLLIDPGKYNFEDGRVTRDFFRDIGILFITHKHADHYDLDAVKNIYQSSSPKIYTVKEISDALKNEGITSSVFNTGNKIQEGPFSIESIVTDHTVNGEKIDCFGLLIKSKGKSFYHTSDTLHLPKKPTGCSVLMVPINNRRVCMNIEEAVKFATEVNPDLVIPVHYDSPKDTHINPQEFVERVKKEGVNSKIMNFGDYIDVAPTNSQETE
ncbi:MAG: MBL fold metallo-hydrolase [Nanoarchaeota archaeon]